MSESGWRGASSRMAKISLVLSIVLNLVFALAVYVLMLPRDSELLNYQEWSILQSLELKHRGAPDGLIIAKDVSGTSYDAVRLTTKDGASHLWVLTNAWYEPKIKTMPGLGEVGKVRMDAAQLASIRSRLRMNEDVELFLRNSVD